jgi:transcriptional regulator with GAF, ATPase, and Fis domain
VITAKNGQLSFHLPRSERVTAPSDDGEVPKILTEDAIRQLERDNLLAALNHTKWKIYGAGGAAELLGLKPTTIASRIERLGLERPTSR